MKFKSLMTSLLLLVLLSGCGLKETIDKADKIVKKENTENSIRAEKEELENGGDNAEERLGDSAYSIDIEKYLRMQENSGSIEYTKEENGDFTEHTIKHSEGKVVEYLATKDSENPISYSVEVFDQKEKTNDKIENGDFGLGLMSNFLIDAKITKQPLELLYDINVKEKSDYKLDEKNILVISPQENGFILQLSKIR